MNSRFVSKTQWQMSLLGSGRHVGAPIQSSLYLITNCDSRSSPCDPSNKRPALVATQPSPQAFSARSFLDSTRLRAVSLFHWSVEQNVRDMQTTTRVTIGCRPRFSPLVASPLDARARVHFPHKIWRKRETARSQGLYHELWRLSQTSRGQRIKRERLGTRLVTTTVVKPCLNCDLNFVMN